MSNSVSDALLKQAGIDGNPMATVAALVAQGQLDAAQRVLEDLVRTSPNRADAWFALGQVHNQRGEFKPTAQALKRAIKLAPSVADGYVLLGNTYLRHGRTGQALETYREGLKQQPDNPLLHFNLGVGLAQSGDKEAAVSSYKRAIELHPPYAQAWFSLGNAYRDLKRIDEAEDAYRRAVTLEPSYADAHANLGGLLASKEDYAGATQACMAALRTAPRHIHALRNLSLSLYKLGRFSEGAEITAVALSVTPEDTMLHYHMGEMLYGMARTGAAEKAREHARRWRSSSNGHAVAEHMAAAILGEGAPERAGDTYLRETFDRFASDFEETLAGLGYRVPEVLCGLIRDTLGGRSGLSILDAGCGTGLCAPFLKPLAKTLIGVDLSGGMLARARERGLYDSLHEAELGAFLAADTNRYDVTVAADVFCYFGALPPSFSAIAAKTEPQGLFGFTVEAMQGEVTAEGFRLGPTGRYQHDAGYVRKALEQAGWTILRFDETAGREEMGQPVPCFMVLAQRA
ncbi:MAG TPA: tetratricopeptide repeat protein [Ferrovibrio sp.]|uniref:tetratricopeptide repeat protein n=1 Tax=Ferrovibrio sp. TaxID=1917215 RepID=UPI002B4B4DC3|nr:tetratricopeptide repeat protein [Ferrovibrio sp.]HLT78565.1 tetratricopeptide repeat protein [Ferrovibrio sp.]